MLIVEDNAFILKTVQEQMKVIGVDYESSTNGEEAIQKVEEYLIQGKLFDIILMDLVMPIKDGYEAASEIRKLEKKYNFEHDSHFICGFSAYHQGLDVEEKCLNHGMTDIMQKPLNI